VHLLNVELTKVIIGIHCKPSINPNTLKSVSQGKPIAPIMKQ